jgi:hypothetical protein
MRIHVIVNFDCQLDCIKNTEEFVKYTSGHVCEEVSRGNQS